MLLIIVCVLFSVVGQLMLKKGMLEVGRLQGENIILYFFLVLSGNNVQNLF